MMSQTTTLVVILLTGDDTTTKTLDRLLWEIQQGVNQWKGSNCPEVHCLYHRFMLKSKLVQTTHFRIGNKSLKFDAARNLVEGNYPPSGSRLRVGTPIVQEVADFLKQLKLPKTGPIRVIIGAHGSQSKGVSPTNLWRYLQLWWQAMMGAFDSSLASLPFEERWLRLFPKFFPDPTPPNALGSKLNSKQPDLLLDDAATDLSHLPISRLETLILHTCHLSCLETMCALRLFPTLIASAAYWPQAIELSSWFQTLGNPSAKPADISQSCFDGITKQAPDSDACYSSHSTAHICDLLQDLNRIGDELLQKLAKDQAGTLDAVKQAWNESYVGIISVDLSFFCLSLKKSKLVSDRTLDSVVDHIAKHQVVPPCKTGKWRQNWRKDFQGICLFLPSPGEPGYSSEDLPCSFRTDARTWCAFLDEWMRLTARGSPSAAGNAVSGTSGDPGNRVGTPGRSP